MTQKSIQFVKAFLAIIGALVLFQTALSFWTPGHVPFFIRIKTGSMPGGTFLLQPLKNLQRGLTVVFCPGYYESKIIAGLNKTSGLCEGGSPPLLKTLVALPGDSVRIDSSGIYVNNQYLYNSKPQKQTSSGKNISFFPFNDQLQEGECLVASLFNERSLDSRYFGPISCLQIWRAIPLTAEAKNGERQMIEKLNPPKNN